MTVSAQYIKSCASEVGFAACGIARAAALSDHEYALGTWLADGFHADMHYMEEHVDMRRNPQLLLDGARSVISVLVPYKYDRLMDGPLRIAQYAYGEDYHQKLKRMLFQLLDSLRQRYPGLDGRPFVDTAPISDKSWAARAGLGWIGFNTLLVNPSYGSLCFLGELVTTADVDLYDQPLDLSPSPCASCRRCVDACPNKAIIQRAGAGHDYYQIDARRCTSYNTIENNAERLPEALHTQGYIFGCDICQLVCPYNQQAPTASALTDEHKAELETLAASDDQHLFKRAARHSALGRIRLPQWNRNRHFGLR